MAGVILASCGKHGEYAIDPTCNRGVACPLCTQTTDDPLNSDPEVEVVLQSMRGAARTMEMWCDVWVEMVNRLFGRKAVRDDQHAYLILIAEQVGEMGGDLDAAALDVGHEHGLFEDEDSEEDEDATPDECNPWGIPEVTVE